MRNASAVKPEMLASVCAPHGGALARARERFVPPYVEVELQLRQANFLDADVEELLLVEAE